MGLATYYRRFVPKFAEIAIPLHKASETSKKFEGTPAAQDAFESFKLKLTSTPILAFHCLREPFIIYTDASHFAMDALLAQVQDGKERAICYASETLSKSQMKYSATRRELLVLVTLTRHFRHYLLGQKFRIVTDHSALQWLHSFKDSDGKTARWLEKLAPLTMKCVIDTANPSVTQMGCGAFPRTRSMQLKLPFTQLHCRTKFQN